MKKTILFSALMLMQVFTACVTTSTPISASSLSTSKVRNHARYLTDRMAYELDFTPMQYDDCYEINYDFVRHVSYIMDDVVRGYYDAINSYYRYLDWRNEDLRYIMTPAQYIRFLSRDYFYRPIYSNGSAWDFRVYTIYSNRTFFYYDAPTIFKSYRGGHSRTNYSNGFYASRYASTPHYTGSGNISGTNRFVEHRRSDFGTNLRDRNQKPDYNNYNNRNSSNRTADPRYRDNSGNQNTPLINGRGSQTGEHRGTSTTQGTTNVPTGAQRSANTTSGTQRGSNTPVTTSSGVQRGNTTPVTTSSSSSRRGGGTATSTTTGRSANGGRK
ncbi:MAG: hypothetical protein IJ064_00150 [Bacteroidaceae bacterium]|nr:hypothetical protein [Bacteroidaceae bacterium]